MRGKQFRQGDILFVKINEDATGDEVPRDNQNRVVVAEGEATGHCHAIHEDAVEMFRDQKLDRAWVVVKEATADVVHEEHDTITLDEGTWRIVYQRQYVRGQVRRVLD